MGPKKVVKKFFNGGEMSKIFCIWCDTDVILWKPQKSSPLIFTIGDALITLSSATGCT